MYKLEKEAICVARVELENTGQEGNQYNELVSRDESEFDRTVDTCDTRI